MEKVNSASGYNLLNNGAGVTQARWDMNTEGTSCMQEEKVICFQCIKKSQKITGKTEISATDGQNKS